MPPITFSLYDGRDWAAIAAAYAARERTVAEICALHTISRDALYYRIREEGWPYRAPIAERRNRSRTGQKDLLQRLLGALNAKLVAFEQHLAGQGGASPNAADAERDARTLNVLVRLFDRLQALKASARSPRKLKRSAAAAEGNANDADDLRSALAQRLERLRLDLGD